MVTWSTFSRTRTNSPEFRGGVINVWLDAMVRGIKLLCELTAVAIMMSHGFAQQQIADPYLRNALVERAVFTANEFAALERGEAVVKLLPTNDRREVAVCGVVKLPAAMDVSLKAFQFSLNQLNQKSILQLGRFSNPPKPDDLNSLTLSRRDIEDLKQCAVHNCKLNLSRDMIERFQKSIDWSAADREAQANKVFRQMLLQYVERYLKYGDAALIEYANDRAPISLRREHDSLISKLLYVNDAVPDFVNYVKAFPTALMSNAEHSLTWAKISFGLKPVIIVNDTVTYQSADKPCILSLAKQIYAHHYFDASLSLTAVVGEDSHKNSYLLYANYSRATALASSFSNFKHRVVESEALDDLRDLMQQTRSNVDVAISNVPTVPESNSGHRFVGWFKTLPRTARWLLVALIIAVFIYVGARLRHRVSNSPLPTNRHYGV
jgi:hypothetical protein